MRPESEGIYASASTLLCVAVSPPYLQVPALAMSASEAGVHRQAAACPTHASPAPALSLPAVSLCVPFLSACLGWALGVQGAPSATTWAAGSIIVLGAGAVSLGGRDKADAWARAGEWLRRCGRRRGPSSVGAG